MKQFTFTMVSLLLLSSITFAVGQNGQLGAKLDSIGRHMTFDDIRASCLDPARFHNQIAPSNIQIACRDVQVKWTPDTNGAVAMGNSRLMTVLVQSDKYETDTLVGAIPSADQVSACPRFKQISESVESLHAVSCDELVAFTGTAVDFCASRVNSLRAANPDSMKILDTGKLYDFCGESAGQRGQRGQQ